MRIYLWPGNGRSGEWFYPNTDISALISALNAGRYPYGKCAGSLEGTFVPGDGEMDLSKYDARLMLLGDDNRVEELVVSGDARREYFHDGSQMRRSYSPPTPGVPGLVVFVEEEYGYRYWRWEFPGTPEELVEDFKAGRAPINFYDPSKGSFRGTLIQLEVPVRPYSAYLHTHEEDDTYLKVLGQTYGRTEASS